MYTFFKIFAFLAVKIYCRKTVANFDATTVFSGPKILASNHPNSFFDAILIAVHYPKPIYFLARGDAFKKPLVANFLKALHLIPIYRLSEGKNNLSKNDATFKKCLELLRQNQTILIFSEGLCVNEWNLRPLKKGTARLALMALKEGIANLEIQPVNLNYSNFHQNPKDVIINFNEAFCPQFDETSKEIEFHKTFNFKLKNGILNKMHIAIQVKKVALFKNKENKLKQLLLAIPASIGFILNYWIYAIFKNFALKKTRNTVFYDSILFGLLFLCYPIIVSILCVFLGLLVNFQAALFLFFLFPLSAWSYREYKS